MADTKECTRCHRVKPLEAFARNSTMPDGLQKHCRECVRTWKRMSPAERERAKGCAEAVRLMWLSKGLRRCRECRRLHPLDAFDRDPYRNDELSSRCRTCQSVYYAGWYNQHADERREYHRKRRAQGA